jgi:hypothetical protein
VHPAGVDAERQRPRGERALVVAQAALVVLALFVGIDAVVENATFGGLTPEIVGSCLLVAYG